MLSCSRSSKDLDGAYNLAAPEGCRPRRSIVEMIGKRRRRPRRAQGVLDAASGCGRLGLAEAPAGMLHYVMYPWVVSVDKLAEAGFKAGAIRAGGPRETLEAIGDSIRLGRNRIPRQRLVRGAAAGAGSGRSGHRRTRHQASQQARLRHSRH